ncbi:hypothetical protein BV22DRAFT_1127108 [Leucogyrophana mollusca]|uniref:Uncharacterized protein n=1 Tax=Leucogyrophana mollusca TaxID=85980 RepID=A0ACB8BQB9_9AGAM|nr:hypothetical protein BV22DRAFT_1127108 [Leucogyrophana mollusca]
MAEKSYELQSGLYIVTSPALKPGSFIGRDLVEDHSLLPKRVVILPPGVMAPRWIVESLGKGRYKLKVMGAPTCEIDKKLFAILIGAESEEWVVKYRPNHDAYT